MDITWMVICEGRPRNLGSFIKDGMSAPTAGEHLRAGGKGLFARLGYSFHVLL